MRHSELCLSAILTLVFVPFAAPADRPSKEERKLEQAASELEKDAAPVEGRRAVEAKLKLEFKVSDDRVRTLRNDRLGYADIFILFTLTRRMPGGISDANIQAIMDLRQGPPAESWDQIAKKRGVKLAKLISGVRSMDAAARRRRKP